MEIDIKRRKYEHKEGRLIPRKKYPKPFRFVGMGVIVMLVIVIILYNIIVC
jgi:uncharacterized membrane protein YukC